ncbi:MAG: M48 family metallopeptidase [Candidatus Scalinduaceae bacterium]
MTLCDTSNDKRDEQSARLSKNYSIQKYILAVIGMAVALIYLVLMAVFGSNILKYFLLLITTNQYVLIALYIFFFTIILDLITIPLSFYGGFVLEHIFKLSNQSLFGWVKDELKKFFISLVLLIFLVQIIYIFLRNFPHSWWIFTTIFWIFFSIIMAKLAPVLIFPLFYKSVPIDKEDIKEGLLSLAEGTGINIEGVYKINLSKNTKKANAALAGLGNTRRVILSDTLIDSYSLAEIRSVFAHELGHHVYHHIRKLLIIGSISGFVGFALCHYVLTKAITILGYQHIHDIAAFPILCLVLGAFGFILMPIQNAYSRRLERECDRYAIKKTNNPEAFISTMDKLAEQNLADRNPNRLIELLFYDHPPISKRIEMAREEIKLKE